MELNFQNWMQFHVLCLGDVGEAV